MLIRSAPKTFALLVGISLLLHLIPLSLLDNIPAKKQTQPVKIKITQTPAPTIVEPEPEPEPEPPPPPPPKPEPKPKPIKPKTPVSPKKDETPPAAPISGLSQDSVVPQGQGAFKANLGNTLLEAPPEVRPVDPPAGDGPSDKSRDAVLIASSVPKVEYTDEALDAGFEGRVVVDVFVETDGTVSSAELRKRVGYALDARLLKAARAATFKPRLNSQGIPERGWAEITFNMVIP